VFFLVPPYIGRYQRDREGIAWVLGCNFLVPFERVMALRSEGAARDRLSY